MLETKSICLISIFYSRCLFCSKITLITRIKYGWETYLYHLRVQNCCNWVDDWVDARLADSCTDVKRAHRAAFTQLSVLFCWIWRVMTWCTCASNPWPFVSLATILGSFCHFCISIAGSQLSLSYWFMYTIGYYFYRWRFLFFFSFNKALCLMLETMGWVLVSFL